MLASGRCHIVAITRWNHVYSCWEPNSDVRGCAKGKANEADIEEALGRSITTDIDTEFAHDTTFQPELVRFHEDLDALPSRIVKVVCSDSATFLLTEDGDLWGWGSFEVGLFASNYLTRDSIASTRSNPTSEHCALKDPKGTKVSPLSQDIASRPVRIITQQVKDVVCGGNHVLILTLSGLVVSWGSNDRCQLGRPNSTTSLSSLQEVADSDLSTCAVHGLPRYVMGIGAGKKTSFVWDKERLCGWGDNTFGQLCTDLTDVVMVPRCILPLWKGHVIKQVKGGEGHTVILKMDGHAMTMGNNDFGQLGRSRSSPLSASLAELREAPYSNMISEPTSAREPRTRLHPGPVPISGIEDISCGDYFTLARCSNGQVSTWGRGVTVHCLYNGRNEKTGARGGTSGSGSEASRKVVAISAMCGSVSIALVSSKVGQSN
ncbi:hypothetical protein BGX31_008146 [Mortierella sp. GBA43]|nr:hypothetical protein BGX31_008146 [Mortierella sp. GBA43]